MKIFITNIIIFCIFLMFYLIKTPIEILEVNVIAGILLFFILSKVRKSNALIPKNMYINNCQKEFLEAIAKIINVFLGFVLVLCIFLLVQSNYIFLIGGFILFCMRKEIQQWFFHEISKPLRENYRYIIKKTG